MLELTFTERLRHQCETAILREKQYIIKSIIVIDLRNIVSARPVGKSSNL